MRSSNIKALSNSAKSMVERNLHHRYDVPVMPRHINVDSAAKPQGLGMGIMHATQPEARGYSPLRVTKFH